MGHHMLSCLAIIIVSCRDKMPKGYHRLIDIARQITLCITPSAKSELFRTLQHCQKKVIVDRYFMIYDLESFFMKLTIMYTWQGESVSEILIRGNIQKPTTA